jgi:hypothetical protein
MSPSEMIGWECGACTFTNDDCLRRDCLMCMTERPERYAIITGASESASARTTTVNHRAQARLAARSSDVPAIAGDTTPAADGVGIRRACIERREQERQAALREGAAAEEEDARREPIAEGAPVLILGGGQSSCFPSRQCVPLHRCLAAGGHARGHRRH